MRPRILATQRRHSPSARFCSPAAGRLLSFEHDADAERHYHREAPAPPGSKRSARGVPLTKGGDNTIQTYGTESTHAARAQAATALRAYLDARAAKDWGRARAFYLAAPAKQQVIEQAKGASAKAPHGCAAALAVLNATNPGAVLRQQAQIGKVLSLRIDGASGCLLFFGAPSRTFLHVADAAGGWSLEGGGAGAQRTAGVISQFTQTASTASATTTECFTG